MNISLLLHLSLHLVNHESYLLLPSSSRKQAGRSLGQGRAGPLIHLLVLIGEVQAHSLMLQLQPQGETSREGQEVQISPCERCGSPNPAASGQEGGQA